MSDPIVSRLGLYGLRANCADIEDAAMSVANAARAMRHMTDHAQATRDLLWALARLEDGTRSSIGSYAGVCRSARAAFNQIEDVLELDRLRSTRE